MPQPPLIQGGYIPIVLAPEPAVVIQGTPVTWTVVLDKTAVGDQTVAVSCSPANAFTNFPSSVVVPNGSARGSFVATTSTAVSGNIAATAVIDGNSIAGVVVVNPDH